MKRRSFFLTVGAAVASVLWPKRAVKAVGITKPFPPTPQGLHFIKHAVGTNFRKIMSVDDRFDLPRGVRVLIQDGGIIKQGLIEELAQRELEAFELRKQVKAELANPKESNVPYISLEERKEKKRIADAAWMLQWNTDRSKCF